LRLPLLCGTPADPMIAYLVAAMETYPNNRNLIISIKLE
jgi:hypothetical protein